MQLLHYLCKIAEITHNLVDMITGKHQINEWELHEIRVLLVEGYSIPEVAKKLGRSKSTLYRLFQNNGIPYKETRYQYIGGKTGNRNKPYKVATEGVSSITLLRKNGKNKPQIRPRQIYLMREQRRSDASRRYSRIQNASKLALFIEQKIRKRWSPEQISGRWRRDTGERLSKDTIYRYVYSTHREWIRKYFRRKWRKYINHQKREALKLLDRKSIELRPKEVETREIFGHWEGDTVVGMRNGKKQCLLTLVERKSWHLVSMKLQDKSGESTYQAFQWFPKNLKKLFKTITFDNGGEFALHSLIEYETKAMIYFAHPYRSSERGTNENTNGLLRQYFPKKTDFSTISEQSLRKAVKEINSRPRKRLWYQTPNEVFKKEKSCIWL